MCDLGAISIVAVRGVVGGGGFDACTLGSVAWGRVCLWTGLVGVGDFVAVVSSGDGTGAGVLSGMICNLIPVSGGYGCLGCFCGQYVDLFRIW